MTSTLERPVLDVADDAIRHLEDEAIQIIREVVAEFDRPALLFSGGKDSAVLLHLAGKALWPAPVPITLLHTTPGTTSRGSGVPRRGGATWRAPSRRRPRVEEWIADGRLTERPTAPGTRCRAFHRSTPSRSTGTTLSSAAGAGRDRARAKERIFSVRDAFGGYPRRQRPELWTLCNGRHAPGEQTRVFPLSNWTELDVWRYIRQRA
jgi:sulfate adenylyltransferase subunit 2